MNMNQQAICKDQTKIVGACYLYRNEPPDPSGTRICGTTKENKGNRCCLSSPKLVCPDFDTKLEEMGREDQKLDVERNALVRAKPLEDTALCLSAAGVRGASRSRVQLGLLAGSVSRVLNIHLD